MDQSIVIIIAVVVMQIIAIDHHHAVSPSNRHDQSLKTTHIFLGEGGADDTAPREEHQPLVSIGAQSNRLHWLAISNDHV